MDRDLGGGFIDVAQVIGSELDRDGPEVFLEAIPLRGARDGNEILTLGEHPGERRAVPPERRRQRPRVEGAPVLGQRVDGAVPVPVEELVLVAGRADAGRRVWVEDFGTEIRSMVGQTVDASELKVYRR